MFKRAIFFVIGLLFFVSIVSYTYAAGMKLAWDASFGATGYRIYYGTTQGSHPDSKDVGDVTEYAISELGLGGGTYYFVIRAYNDAGESEDSNEVFWKAPESYHAPLPPTGVTVEQGSLIVKWNAHSDMNVTGYKVYYGTAPGVYGAPIDVPGRDSTSCTIDGLTEGVTYYVAVTAYNDSGEESEYSQEVPKTYTVADTTPPTGSITINNGAASTDAPIVTLSLSATDTGSGMGSGAQMVVSNDGQNWSGPLPYATSMNYSLPSGDGTKTVYVKYADAAGNWMSVSVQDQIDLITPNQLPTATASADVTSGEGPLAVAFTGTGSDADGTIASYAWAFGDGATSSEQNPSHTYHTPGSYSAVLTVTDDKGATGQATVSVSVAAAAARTVLEITNISRSGYNLSILAVGKTYYSDSSYTIASLPSGFEGLAFIETKNSDRKRKSQSWLSFDVNRDVAVYVCYDKKFSSPPAWVTASFTKTGDQIGTSLADQSYLRVWKKLYSAGTITLGANMALGCSGSGSNYIVVIEER